MVVAASDHERLVERLEGVAADAALDATARVAALRSIDGELRAAGAPAWLIGKCFTYMADAELEREARSVDHVIDRALLREDADIRGDLLAQGVSAEALDAAGLVSHDELDERERDGTLEEGFFGNIGAAVRAAAANWREALHPRERGGRFRAKPGAPLKMHGRDGNTMPTAKPTVQPAKPAPAAAAPASEPKPKPRSEQPPEPKPEPPEPKSAKPQHKPPAPPASPGAKKIADAMKDGEHEERMRLVQEHGLNDWPPKGELAQQLLGDATDTQMLHTRPLPASPGSEGGPEVRGYTPERRIVHDAIVGEFLGHALEDVLSEHHPLTQKLFRGERLSEDEKAQVREAAAQARGGGKPLALFMAGGPASGKTSALKASPELEPDGSVLINPDEIKDRLPEYRQMIEGREKYAATGVHEESSDLGKRLQSEALDLGLNVVVDGTGDSKPGKFTGKMTDMDKAGYDVSALYVTIPTDEAVVRATSRAMKSGRWVPEPEIRSQHKNVSGNFEDVSALPFLKDLKLFDNGGDGGPELIAEAGNGELRVLSPEAYQSFIEKRDE